MFKIRKKIILLSSFVILLAVAYFFFSVQSRPPLTANGVIDFHTSMATPSLLPIHFSPSEKAKLLSEHFVEIKDANAFPDACKKAFSTLIQEPTFSLANPGQPFQATDAISIRPRQPWRRLIIGGKASDFCIIYYEKGGFSTTYQAVLIDISKKDAPTFVWGGFFSGSPHDIHDLVKMITLGNFEQGSSNTW